MPRYVLATTVLGGADGECTSLEWRIRAAVGELRRGGLAVLLERVLPVPDGRRCLFVVVAASERVVTRLAELAQLAPFDIAEARDRSAATA